MRRAWAVWGSWAAGCAAVALAACAGDDTNTVAPVDASVGIDAPVVVHPDAAPAPDAAPEIEAGPCAPYDASALTDAEIQMGAAIVQASRCEQCHGEMLQGSSTPLPSTNAEGGVAYAPDLTPDPVNGLGCWTDDQIIRAFLHGIDNEGDPLCNPMPHWGEIDGGINDAGAVDVLAYLRTIPIVVNPNVPNTGNCPFPVDAGPEEAGADAGSTDAGAVDASDAGPVDASDAGAVDASDAGLADAGDAAD